MTVHLEFVHVMRGARFDLFDPLSSQHHGRDDVQRLGQNDMNVVALVMPSET